MLSLGQSIGYRLQSVNMSLLCFTLNFEPAFEGVKDMVQQMEDFKANTHFMAK